MGVGGRGSRSGLPPPGPLGLTGLGRQFGVLSRTYRVLRFDFRGYGRSSRPEPGRPYSHLDDLAAVMDAAGVERAALVGKSMGGKVAIDFALTHPGRVSALVLASPALSGFEGTPDEEATWEAAFADWSARSRRPSRRATSKGLRTCGCGGSGLRSVPRTRRDRGSGRSRSRTCRSSRWTKRGDPDRAPGRRTVGRDRGSDARAPGRSRPALARAHVSRARRGYPRRSPGPDPPDRSRDSTSPTPGVQRCGSELPRRDPLSEATFLVPTYLRASSFACCAAAMILSARCDGTSS